MMWRSVILVVALVCSLTSGLVAQLRVVYPNGGESFRVGSKMTIVWTGVLPTDVITLEYSTDNGASWNLITNSAKGLQYTWLNIPNTVSAACLLRATFQTATPATLRLFGSGNFGNADFSQDGNLVISGSADGNAYIWDSHSAQLIHTFRTESGAGITMKALNSWGTFSPNMKTFATVSPTPDGPSNGNRARIFDAATGAKLHEWLLLDPSNLAYATGHCQFSPDGTRLAVTGEDSIRVFDIASEAIVSKLAGFVRADAFYTEHNIANYLDWKPDGSDILAGITIKSDSIPTYIRASAATGDTLQCYRLKSSYPHVVVNTGVHYSPDGLRFIASTEDTSVRVWNVATGAVLFTIRPGLWESVDAIFSHDGKTIATLGYDSLGLNSYNVKLWSALDGSFIRWVGTLGFGSGTIEFSPDDARILVSSSGNNVIFQVAQTGLESDLSDGAWSIVPNTGQNVVVYTPDASAYVNDLIDIPVLIDDPGGAVAAGASSVSFDLHFNETMLEPIGTTPMGTITGTDRALRFTLPIVATDTVLTMLHFRVALGDDSVTKLAVAKPLTNSAVVTATNTDGTFKLLGLCTAGGPRLLNPDLWRAYNPLVLILHLQGKLGEAERIALEYVANAPEEYNSYFALGYYYISTGAHTAAIALYEQAFKLNPQHLATLFNLVIACHYAKEEEKQTHWSEVALPLYEKQLRLYPEDENMRVQHATFLVFAGRDDEAREATRRLKNLKDGAALYNVASLQCELKDHDAALATFRKSIQAGFRNDSQLKYFLDAEDGGVERLKGTPEYEEVKRMVEKIEAQSLSSTHE